MSSVRADPGGARCSRSRVQMQIVKLMPSMPYQAALDEPCIDDIYMTLNFTVKDSNAPTSGIYRNPDFR